MHSVTRGLQRRIVQSICTDRWVHKGFSGWISQRCTGWGWVNLSPEPPHILLQWSHASWTSHCSQWSHWTVWQASLRQKDETYTFNCVLLVGWLVGWIVSRITQKLVSQGIMHGSLWKKAGVFRWLLSVIEYNFIAPTPRSTWAIM